MAIHFVQDDSSDGAVAYLADCINARLRMGDQVLWLVSGGSAVGVAVGVAKLLQGAREHLVVSLIDERYGPDGHADSNWKQLVDAGFAVSGATMLPVLHGQDMATTATDFEANLRREFAAVDYRIGLLGIGPDGHTSGILPSSPAVSAPGLVCAYEGGGYKRITTTAAALAMLDEAVVYAMGEAKWPVLDSLETDVPVAEQPAQYLKRIPKVTIFNDHKGETV